MNFKKTINNLVSLFDEKVLDGQSFKTAVQNAINKYHFIAIHFKHEILDYGFEVINCQDGVVVNAYKFGKKIHTRIIQDTDNDVRIYNYCNKFASDPIYRSMRIRQTPF